MLLRRVGDRGVSLFSSALLRERIRADDPFFDNDNRPLSPLPNIEPLRDAAVADRFRNITVWLIVISSIVAAAMEAVVRVRVDPGETYVLEWLIAALLSVSLMWSGRSQLRRVSDAMGALGLAWLGGMTGGIIAMLELRLHYPLADPMLRSWDLALGIDGLAIVDMLIRQGQWIFKIMALAYNYTLALFFVGIILLALIGDRVEAWRASLCFVGTLFTTCVIAVFVPAKGLGMWASQALFDRLPAHAMRSFWPHFDDFYFGAAPVLRLQAIDGVISFPSFHSVVGFLVLAMWRRNRITLLAAAAWLFFMLLATLPGGGHYVVDLIAGFAVWAAWFGLSRRIERRAVGSIP